MNMRLRHTVTEYTMSIPSYYIVLCIFISSTHEHALNVL